MGCAPAFQAGQRSSSLLSRSKFWCSMASTMVEYRNRMNQIFIHLGGKCAKCDATEDLQVDHKNHEYKSFTIASNWSRSWKVLLPELEKCQLLCKQHHLQKTLEEGSLAKGWTTQPQNKHGTAWMYSKYGCRCVACKAAKKQASKKKNGA